MKYIVLKPFKYNMKDYVRGDEFDNTEINIPNAKIDVRVKAGIIIEESRLTPTEKAKIVRSKISKPADKPAEKPTEKPAEKPMEKEEPKAEPMVETAEQPTEEPTLFGSNVGGGKGKNKRN